jgi:uncharacterized NAD-dependent epimerase/dehydratase family protein
MQKTNAIIITAGHLDSSNGKTAHGLIRGTERFNIVAVIDNKHPGTFPSMPQSMTLQKTERKKQFMVLLVLPRKVG